MSDLQQFLSRLMRRENLARDEAATLLDALLDGQVTDGQIAATLIALALKGETADELAGMAAVMRERAVRIRCSHARFIDTAGTGSSAAKTFNLSTAAGFVVAGAGLPVAKHGGRAASSLSGSADVLTKLGVNVTASPEVSEQCLNEIGICFMFAPLYHTATARVASVRRELGVRTTFNLLGPLTNPAGAPRQIIGVSNVVHVELLARALAALGTERAWVVHGLDGLDEVTLNGPTMVAEVYNRDVRMLQITPEDFGLKPATLDHIRSNDAEASASIIRQVLSGDRRDEARQLVILNAAAALMVSELAQDFRGAARLAENSIDSGQANAKLELLVRMSNE